MIIADTNVWSEAVRQAPNPAVVRWLASHRGELALTTITLGELAYGIAIMPAGKRKEALETRLRRLVAGAEARTFAYDARAAAAFASIKAARRRAGREVVAPEDAMIAAIARVHDCAVATRNVADFDGMGIDVVNPWETS